MTLFLIYFIINQICFQKVTIYLNGYARTILRFPMLDMEFSLSDSPKESDGHIFVNDFYCLINRKLLIENSGRRDLDQIRGSGELRVTIPLFEENEQLLSDLLCGKKIVINSSNATFLFYASKCLSLKSLHDLTINYPLSHENWQEYFSSCEIFNFLIEAENRVKNLTSEDYEETKDFLRKNINSENVVLVVHLFLSFIVCPTKKIILELISDIMNEFKLIKYVHRFIYSYQTVGEGMFDYSGLYLNFFLRFYHEYILGHKRHNEIYEELFETNELFHAVRLDDLNFLKKKELHTLNYELKLNINVLDPANINFQLNLEHYGRIYLIEYAAFYGSIKCFKFLLLKNIMLPFSLPRYAVAGGNSEIIRLCVQNNLNFLHSCRSAIHFHHTEILKWLLEQKIADINYITLISCANYEFIASLLEKSKIDLCLLLQFFTSIDNNGLIDYFLDLNEYLVCRIPKFFNKIDNYPVILKTEKLVNRLHKYYPSQLSFYDQYIQNDDESFKEHFIYRFHKKKELIAYLKYACQFLDPKMLKCFENKVDFENNQNIPLSSSSKKETFSLTSLGISSIEDLLVMAIYRENIEMVQYLLDTFQLDVTKSDSTRHAFLSKNHEICCLIISHKTFDINQTYNLQYCEEGATALHFAAQNGMCDIAKILINKGVDINAITTMGSSALSISISNHYDDISSLLLSHPKIDLTTRLKVKFFSIFWDLHID
ncbi:hypothetical protein TRFO_16069 [Tritrichomonas foetus]|uniref:DUF3447 domain-containing protein n=1 Tax=Tritrichomonas foetus TaxID=1144522 RepID=A0A1J4KVH7_9EUKA|nr:hypothetical protein TRFO_16069 [Tritrichomonas foetus]|eukprot:OHT13740.1 hypothetical protein TRFO_16069 [Tritrichomonas foetus]